MSHEGIRVVSKEQAEKEAWEDRELPRDAKDPAKVRVHKTEGTGLEIDWKDGHKSAWSFVWLRDACPCATCHDEREKSGRAPGEPREKQAAPAQAPQSPAEPGSHVTYQWRNPLLPIYKEPLRVEHVSPVGNYALSFVWNDGHKSGIYSWDYLRRHCQCEECKASSPAE